MRSLITAASCREVAEQINLLCQELKDACVYKTLPSYPIAEELLRLAGIFSPDALLIDLSGGGTPLALAHEIRECFPRTAIIGFVQREEQVGARLAMEAGVDRILPVRCTNSEFLMSFERAVQGRQADVLDNIIAFLPGKAGSGATTLVLHVAASLAQRCRQKLLVMEADLCSGILCHLLELQPSGHVIQAIESCNGMNDGAWSRLVSKVRGFDLLPMPPAREPATLSRWEYQRLLTFARSRYEKLIVDLPDVVDDYTVGLVSQAKEVYVVSTPDPASLLLTRRRIDELKSEGMQEGRLKVLLNRRWNREGSLEEVEKSLGRPVDAWFPEDASWLRRTTLTAAQIGAETEFGHACLKFAHMLAGLEGPAPFAGASPEQKPTGLRSLLNRMPISKPARAH